MSHGKAEKTLIRSPGCPISLMRCVVLPFSMSGLQHTPSLTIDSHMAKSKSQLQILWQQRHRKLYNKRWKIWGRANKEKLRHYFVRHLKKHPDYLKVKSLKTSCTNKGITIEDFGRLLVKQKDACAICKKECKKRLSIDHCHKTGRVRGLLCQKCNFALGLLNDDKKLIKRMLKYLI